MKNSEIKEEIVARIDEYISPISSKYSKTVTLLSTTFYREYAGKPNNSTVKIRRTYAIQISAPVNIDDPADQFVDHFLARAKYPLGAEYFEPMWTEHKSAETDNNKHDHIFQIIIDYIHKIERVV